MNEIVNKTENSDVADLILYQCDMEKCNPSHSYGPAIRDHFLIHYILDGEGDFYVDGNEYHLYKNQGFLICPDIITFYKADRERPWSYTWVGFRGAKSEYYLNMAGLNRENPIFTYEDCEFIKRCFSDIKTGMSLKYGGELKTQGLLSIFLAELIENSMNKEITREGYKDIYIKKVIHFIEANYSRNISISDIADYLGLHRNYLSTLFKEKIGVSPQEYLIRIRMDKASLLLKNRNLSVGDVARSVGYNDQLGFSKIFKKSKGLSPKEFRNIG